jgi:hypothetical protein
MRAAGVRLRTEWRELDLDTAMEMVTDRVLDARRKGWQDTDENGDPLRRTMGLASLGGGEQLPPVDPYHTHSIHPNWCARRGLTAAGPTWRTIPVVPGHRFSN